MHHHVGDDPFCEAPRAPGDRVVVLLRLALQDQLSLQPLVLLLGLDDFPVHLDLPEPLALHEPEHDRVVHPGFSRLLEGLFRFAQKVLARLPLFDMFPLQLLLLDVLVIYQNTVDLLDTLHLLLLRLIFDLFCILLGQIVNLHLEILLSRNVP